MATRITKIPTGRVRQSALDRDGNTVKAKWKVPSSQTKDSNHRATGQKHKWVLTCKKGSTTVSLVRVSNVSVSSTSSSININNYTAGSSSTPSSYRSRTFTRSSFHPHTSLLLTKITHTVWLRNGVNSNGGLSKKKSTVTINMSKPDAPSISSLSFDVETGIATIRVTAAKSTRGKDCYRTQVELRVNKMQDGKSIWQQTWKVGNKNVDHESSAFYGSTKDIKYDCKGYQELRDGQWYKLSVIAWSEGLAGDSAKVERVAVVSPPAYVTAKTPRIDSSIGGRVTLPITYNFKYAKVKVNGKYEQINTNRVTGVVLQAAVNVTARTASTIPGDAWNDVGSVDNGACDALTANSSDLAPEVNNYSYLRVKSWHFDANCAPMCRYSNIVALTGLRTTDTAVDDECAILAITPLANGDGVQIDVGFDKKDGSSRDDADGTEISWADYQLAWDSNEEPDTFEHTGKLSTAVTNESDWRYQYRNIWYYVYRLYIRGLEEGTQYWFRARRYNVDDNGTKTFGSYCQKIWGTKSDASQVTEVATVTPTLKPSVVSLVSDEVVPTGSDVSLSWTFDGGEQTAWRLYMGNNWSKVVKSANNASPTCVLKASEYEQYVDANNTFMVAVEVSTSKRRDTFTRSSWVTIRVAQSPSVRIVTPDVTSLPAPIYLFSTVNSHIANVTITARGSGDAEEVGIPAQVENDDVYGIAAECEWTLTTWGETTWYTSHVVPAVEATATAYAALNYQTETFTGGTNVTIADVADDESGSIAYIVLQPSGITYGTDYPDLSTTLVVGSVTYDTGSGTWCKSDGTEPASSESPTHIRLPLPTPLDDEAGRAAFVGSTVTVKWLPVSEADAWGAYVTLRATSDDMMSIIGDTSNSVYVATVEIPSGTDLRDNAIYDAHAQVSSVEGLASNIATDDFTVQWAHQAPKLTDAEVTIAPYDTTDEDGNRTIGCLVTMPTFEEWETTDELDLWRVSSDGHHMVASGLVPGAVVNDQYAPFGDGYTAYRVVSRTANGDVDWADFEYSHPLWLTRIDFGNSYIELPYNLQISHGYTKESEQRTHLGESLPRGYWGSTHGRTCTVSSSLVRRESIDERSLIHELGCYMGPVFVRTPDGCCMEGEVLPDTSMSYSSAATPVNVQVTEIQLTDEHMASVPEPEDGD